MNLCCSDRERGTINVSSGSNWDFPHRNIARDLLYQIVDRYAQFNINYFKRQQEFPFAYTEFQNSPVLYQAMVNIPTAVAFAQEPIDRYSFKSDVLQRRRSTNWIDFWILYRNVVFLMEYKHRVTGLKKNMDEFLSDDINSAKSAWDLLAKAIGNRRLNADTCSKHCYGNGLKLALLVCPIGRRLGKQEPISENRLSELCSSLEQQIKKPDWRALWQPPDLQSKRQHADDDEEKDYYPRVFFFAKIIEAPAKK